MSDEIVLFGRIYSETVNQIERHLERVKEGRDVDAACMFGRWLFWSGIPRLLTVHSTPSSELPGLQCDGYHLSCLLNLLITACNDYYRTNHAVGLTVADVSSLHEKLDKLFKNQEAIAGQLCKMQGFESTSGSVGVSAVGADITHFGSSRFDLESLDKGLDASAQRTRPAFNLIKGKTSTHCFHVKIFSG